MNFWTEALRYHAPATIGGYIFFKLISLLLEKDNLFNSQPWLVALILIVVANFCAYLLYRSTSKTSEIRENYNEISRNKVSNNKVDGSLSVSAEVSSQPISITDNELNDNSIKGNLVIGVNRENGK